MKVAINTCYGGFGLSDTAYKMLIEEYGWTVTDLDSKGHVVDESADIIHYGKRWGIDAIYGLRAYSFSNELRSNSDVISVIEKLGTKANGRCANIKIIKVPDGVDWEISEYDGMESIEESHRSWS